MTFEVFKTAVQQQFSKMASDENQLFIVDTDRDTVWYEKYLGAFPEGSNQIFRERTEHDCSCCKAFVRQAGGIVSLDEDYNLVSIWDIRINNPAYQAVADSLSAYVKALPIANILLSEFKAVGVDHNFDSHNSDIRWSHFHLDIPERFVKTATRIGTLQSKAFNAKNVFKRALEEIESDAIDIVLDLIGQNSLYRGDQYKRQLAAFKGLQSAYYLLWNASHSNEKKQENFAWKYCIEDSSVSHIRNSSIGTLLVDLSEGMDLEKAVKRYDKVTAPANYKRPSALVTPRMIENAKQEVASLGLMSALSRRFATYTDLDATDMLFVDRDVPIAVDGFDELMQEAGKRPQKLDKVEEIGIEDFISNVLPKVTAMEVMVENRHERNLMSLVAPAETGAPSLFQWDNGFSWAYNGDVTDSIRERVKAAGGDVHGYMRASLSWFNYDDLDLHSVYRSGSKEEKIYYSTKSGRFSGGRLDVDMNANTLTNYSNRAVENIVWKNRPPAGIYSIGVHNYQKRESKDVGFEVEFEFNGNLMKFAYDKAVRNGEFIDVIGLEVKADGTMEVVKSLPSTSTSRSVWGIETERFQPVSLMLLSPNFWGGKQTGNQHYFFMLKNCRNPEAPRGFYNEFLKPELNEHRKVFEILGNKMRVEMSDDQLSGIGFSSTQRNSVTCRVSGSFNRTLKINF
ncbi:MAG: hypothetical protein PVI43_00380 [Candidatus Bathyarchaeota archaeon]